MKTALVLGGAVCLWDDIAAAEEIGKYDAVCACNDAGAAWAGDLHIWATLHPELMAGWVAKREFRGRKRADLIAYHRKGQAGEPAPDIVTDYHYLRTDKSASSGLLTAKVAVEQGFDRIVLCGVPLTATGGHFYESGGFWRAASSFQEGFRQMAPHLLGKVRSMSGVTREVLGVPTAEWLAGKAD